mgnify:CR=1 FL=1
MKILVTGASGMVGRNIVEQPYIKSNELLIPRSQELDLCDKQAVDQYVERHQPDCIIHSAGRVGGIQANIKEPYTFLQQNLMMGLNIVSSAYKYKIKKMVNLGSSCMYPKSLERPIRESDLLTAPLEPTNEGYALAKISVAKAVEYIVNEDDSFRYTTLIPCNLYGKYDSFEPSKSHLIPAIIVKVINAAKTGEPVTVWGSGTVRREFMYAEDFANFVAYILEKDIKMPTYLNVGLGYDYTIKEYYQSVAKVLGYQGDFEFDPSKPEGMKRKLVDIALLNKSGWKANTTLEQGILKTVDYYLSCPPTDEP